MDEIDRATEYYEKALEANIEAARKPIPEGKPGVCYLCDEEKERLVNGACAPCREKYNLP